MKNLELEWPAVESWLKTIAGFDPKAVQTFFQEGQVKKGIHFFWIEYEPGEIIMAKGSTSDFAALHLQGAVRVLDVAPEPSDQKGCWTSPFQRRLENIVLHPPLLTPVFQGPSVFTFEAGKPANANLSALGMWPIAYRVEKATGQTGLPAGMKLDEKTGELSGTPKAVGTSTFTLFATNETGEASRIVTIAVKAEKPPEPTPTPSPSSPFAFLRPLYRAMPAAPLGLIRFADFWMSPAWGDRLRLHLRNVFGGRPIGAPRPERDLSRPTHATKIAAEGKGIVLTIRDKNGNELPLEGRFLGITGTLWNQPRSVTLVAENDGGDRKCQMLLIKRKAFQEIVKKCPAFYERKMVEFVNQTLPTILAKNRLFRERIFATDVLDWGRLLRAIQGKANGSPLPSFLRNLAHNVPERTRDWISEATDETLRPEEKLALLRATNVLLGRRDLIAPGTIDKIQHGADDRTLLANAQENFATLNDVEMSRLNRLALETALPGALKSGPTPCPMTRPEFQAFTRSLARKHEATFKKALQPERFDAKDMVVVKQGDPADAVYLVLSGMLRVHLETAGGRTMINNLEADAFFGEAAILVSPDGPILDSPMPVRKATVETLCASNLLKLDRNVLLAILHEDSLDTELADSKGRIKKYNFSTLADKLRNEHASFKALDVQISAGRILPPHEPPQEIAQQLLLTRNVLLIDMSKCTRCDQCVRGCAEAHDFMPRFHRANPDMRFGDWEVAGACMNCLDAPCQQACPVGAITLLDSQAVQIHRDRCVSCDQCAKQCPFHVIDMYAPVTPFEAPSMSPKKGTVATKCDLCLTENHDPPCVACCPYDAAKRVDPLEFFPELREWANIAHR